MAGKERQVIYALLSILFVLAMPIACPEPLVEAAEPTAEVWGTVVDHYTEATLANATLLVWDQGVLRTTVYADSRGAFSIACPIARPIVLYSFADIASTGGRDYLPVRKELNLTSNGIRLDIRLKPCATIVMEGDIQFVDTTSSVAMYSSEIYDPVQGELLTSDGFPLRYGSYQQSQSRFLFLDPKELLVPVSVPFDINITATVVVGGRTVPRSTVIEVFRNNTLAQGEIRALDMPRYVLPYSFGIVDADVEATSGELEKMERLGFYLFVEKQSLASVLSVVDLARFEYQRSDYVASFKELRRAFIKNQDLLKSLVDMFRSAETSVYVLIFFLALTSTAITFLLFEKTIGKVLSSALLTTGMHAVLHVIYPGASYVPVVQFVLVSVVSWILSLIATILLPRFLKGSDVGGRTPLRNIIVPIFSLAKRSLVRRRMRFALTLSSVTILVMSFVALTSFSMGYGLIFSRLSNQYVAVEGVLLRAPVSDGFVVDQSFTPIEQTAIVWASQQKEVAFAVPKAQSLPFLVPLSTLNGRPIFGIIGIVPETEARVLQFESAIVEGRYLRQGENDAILICRSLQDTLRLSVGSTAKLGRLSVRIVGILDEGRLGSLLDLDGSSIVPDKLVNKAPPGDIPVIEPEPVAYDELVVCAYETAMSIPGVVLQRVNVVLSPGKSATDFAERAALERNYRAWASSSEGLYIAMLGVYFQGKGMPLAIPWAIVVLTVVITMLNSLHERRREVSILSAVGLNPAHVGSIFVAEATAIGIIGGGAGYLLGLAMYNVMTYLQVTLEVKQKVSAFWSIGALGIAMTAVIIGALTALRGSVVITPSLMRRWQIEDRRDLTKPIELELPIVLPETEIDEFMRFVLKEIRSYEDDPVVRTERIKFWDETDAGQEVRSIRFIHRTVGPAFTSYSVNVIQVRRVVGEHEYRVQMNSVGDKSWVHQTGTLVRHIIMRWSTRKQVLR